MTGGDISERLLDFAARIGKGVDALLNQSSQPNRVEKQSNTVTVPFIFHFAFTILHFTFIYS